MANLLLDEVTGEKVSKTELKRRQKQREKDAKKKEKEAAAPPKPKAEKKKSAEEEEANLTPNVSNFVAQRTSLRAMSTNNRPGPFCDGGAMNTNQDILAILRDP